MGKPEMTPSVQVLATKKARPKTVLNHAKPYFLSGSLYLDFT